MRRVDPALLVVLAGVSAALHVGKLPPALPVLREALGISLLEAGFLLSLVQLAGMTLGLVCGVLADSLGLRRTMTLGLALLSAASFAGGWATGPAALLALRAIEGLGFLLAAMPAPGLIRRVVAPGRMNRMLGLWGAYMPLGTALALLLGPAVMAAAGWPAWWWGLGAVSMLMAVWIRTALPASCDAQPSGAGARDGMLARIRQTLAAPGPWLVAVAFAVYSAQWLSVIGFLPSIYAQAGVAGGGAAVATALAAGVNMIGNIASGRLLQRGVMATRLLHAGYSAMLLGAMLAFGPWWHGLSPAAESVLRYSGVLLFSAVGGMVPGTLFAVGVRVAPHEGTVSTTVGWMQQWSALGQFAGPPVVAWVAARTGGWDYTWLATGACAVAGMALAQRLVSQLRQRP
jgi:CP family cyanate transporter-like MFS transporter